MSDDERARAEERLRAYLDEVDRVNDARRGWKQGDVSHSLNMTELRRSDVRRLLEECEQDAAEIERLRATIERVRALVNGGTDLFLLPSEIRRALDAR